MSFRIGYTQLKIKDETRWNNLLFVSPNGSYRASMSYEYSKKLIGRETNTIIFHKNGEDIAGAHYSLKSSFAGIIKTADILSGVVFKNEPEEDVLSFILDHFINWAKDKNASFMRFNPWIPSIIKGQKAHYFEILEKTIKKHGFSPITKGRNTYWLDLTQSEDQLLNNMRRKTRYDIRKGIKSKLRIQLIDKPDNQITEQFLRLYNQLGKEKDFNKLSGETFKHEVHTLLRTDFASLFVAIFNDEIVNISMASKKGIASYMYGAINPNFKMLKDCPAPGYLAQWEMIKTMKKLGLQIYDLGFCPGPIPDQNHPAYNIWRFKYGFGGIHVQFMPTYGKVLNPITGSLFQLWKYRK